jgi:hypothetical protein
MPDIAPFKLNDLMRVLIAAGDWLPLDPIKYAMRPAMWGVA